MSGLIYDIDIDGGRYFQRKKLPVAKKMLEAVRDSPDLPCQQPAHLISDSLLQKR